MTKKGLEDTIKHYIKHKDYLGAKNYANNFGDMFKDFNKEEALKEIDEAQKGRIKSEKKIISKED